MALVPLRGVRVLDLSRVLAGPLCAQYLGDMGADVIKVEDTHGGDDTRQWPSFRRGPNGQQTSAVFVSANRNKRSIAIDLKTQAGRDLVHRMARRADVVIESFAPGVAARLGVDGPTMCAINPRLVHCSITGFGTVGSMRGGKGYDLILQAFSGMLSITGDRDSPPMRSPFSPVDQGTGLHALIGILAALYARETTGRGGMVETSLFDTSTAFLGYFLHNYWEQGTEPEKAGVGHAGLCPYGVFETADRPLVLGVANDALWRRFCSLAGIADEPGLEELATNELRVKNRAKTNALVTSALGKQGRAYWFALLDEAGIPCSPLHTLGEFAAHPHTRESGMVYEYLDPNFGPMNAVSQPIRFDGSRGQHDRHAPLYGEHTVEILQEAGLDAAAIQKLVDASAVHVLSTQPQP